MSAMLTFYGAAGTVTGSCSLVAAKAGRFLIDCGLYQGNRSVRDLNGEVFPFGASAVDFVVLTHAHIDHSGLVPKLVKEGFGGPIFATLTSRRQTPSAAIESYWSVASLPSNPPTQERMSKRPCG